MDLNYVKVGVTALMSMLAAALGVLYIPVLLMVLCNVIDYITGLFAAKYRTDGGISSYRSMRGIMKKVCMWLLVVVGAIMDALLSYASNTFGYQLPFTFLIACVVTIWIVCNEVISILENMVDIGVSIPGFLLPIVKQLKTTVEHMGTVEDLGNPEQKE